MHTPIKRKKKNAKQKYGKGTTYKVKGKKIKIVPCLMKKFFLLYIYFN